MSPAMTHSLALDAHPLAQELHQLLREIDPARWKDSLEARARERLASIRDRLSTALEREQGDTHLRERLQELAAKLEVIPDGKRAWQEFRTSVAPAYEHLAVSLKGFDIHVPSLRPTNYLRNLYHFLNGAGVVALVHFLLTPTTMLYVAGGFFTAAWSLEAIRRISPRANEIILIPWKRLSHPHERFRVNSATWFTTAMLFLALMGDTTVACVAVAVLAVGDPMAALVGRRWGRTKLLHGRTLEGTMAFAVTGTLAALLTLSFAAPALALWPALGVAAASATTAAVAELVSRRVDDNLSIPVSAAVAAITVLGLVG